MELPRGFPEFMRALPPPLENNPGLQVVIAGADRRAYSYDAPSHNGSWRGTYWQSLAICRERQHHVHRTAERYRLPPAALAD